MKQAIGYIRVSHELQLEGVSLAAQRDRIKAYCQGNGFELLEVYEDKGISGKRQDNRPGLQKALEACCKQKAILIVYSLSRLARSVKDAIEITTRLNKCGADLASITEKIDTSSAIGQFFFTVMSALAQFESEQTGERINSALNHLRKQGKKLGGKVPYGYEVGKERVLVPVKTEQKGLGIILNGHKQGLSMAAIAEKLTEAGIQTKNGGKWYPGTVYQILERQEKA